MHRIVFKPVLKVTGFFCNITDSRWLLKSTVQKKNSKQSLFEVNFKNLNTQKSIVWTVISNQMMKYQLPHSRFDRSLLNEKRNVVRFLLISFVNLVQWFENQQVATLSCLWGFSLGCKMFRKRIDPKNVLL